MINYQYTNEAGYQNVQDIVFDIFAALKEELGNMASANIIVCGKTGVGKSTLINNIFREHLADTGIGEPITTNMKIITREDVPVRIYDTRGLELDSAVQAEIRSEINNTIRSKLKQNKTEDFIHVIWYCVNSNGHRIEESEIKWIQTLLDSRNAANVPVILILTQSIIKKNAKKFVEFLETKDLNVTAIIPILAEDCEIDEEQTIKAYGLDKLVRETVKLLPDSVKRSFINAQNVDIASKVTLAKKYVDRYCKAAFATGFSPIPWSDAPLLIGNQVIMIAHITTIFGLNMQKSMITAIVSTLAGSSGATFVGKTIVANLLKLIPGCGSALGGLISASTASALTLAMGNMYIMILEELLNMENVDKLANSEEVFARIKSIVADKFPSI